MADNEVSTRLTANADDAVDAFDDLGDAADDAANSVEKSQKKIGESIEKVGGRLSQLGGALSIGLTAPIIGVGGAALQMGLNAVEAEDLFERSFGSMANAAREWSETTSNALGLNSFELRQQIAPLFLLAENMGLNRDAAFDMAKSLGVLSADLSSAFDVDQDVALAALQSGLVGNTEALRSLNIFVNDASLRQIAFEKGITSTNRQLNQQEKFLAINAAIMDQTAVAQGNLAETAESPTNRIRAMGNAVREAGTRLGVALIPALERALPLFESAVGVVERVVDRFSKLPPKTQEIVVGISLAAAALGPLLIIMGQVVTAGGSLISVMGGISGSATTTAGAVAKLGPGLSTAAAGVSSLVAQGPAAVSSLTSVSTLMPTIAAGASSAGAAVSSIALPALAVGAAAFVGVGIGSALNNMAVEARGGADAIDRAVEEVGLLRAGLSLVPDIVSGLTGFIRDMGSALVDIGSFVTTLPGIFLDWVSSLGVVQTTVALVQTGLEALGPVGDFVIAVFTGIRDVAVAVFGKIGEVLGALGTPVAFLQEKIQGLGASLFSFRTETLEPLGNATAEQKAALEAFQQQQQATIGTTQQQTVVTQETTSALANFATNTDTASKAQEALQRQIDSLSMSLGVSGLQAETERINQALEQLNERGERLSSQGLDRVLKKMQELKNEGLTLPPTFQAIDDKFKAFASNALANLPMVKVGIDETAFAADAAGGAFDEMATLVETANGELVRIPFQGIPGLEKVETKTIDWSVAQSKVNDFLSKARGFMDLLGVSADSTLGRIIGGVTKVFDIFNSLTGVISQVSGLFGGGGLGGLLGGGGGIGSVLGGLFGGGGASAAAGSAATAGTTAGAGFTSGFAGAAQSGLSSLGSTLVPFFTNPFTIGIGAAIGGFFLLKSIFGKQANIQETVERDFGVPLSEALEAELAKIGEDRGLSTAAALGINKIFDDALASGQAIDPNLFAERFADTFSFLERGDISKIEAEGILGDSVPRLLSQLDQLGSDGSAQIERLLRASEDFGLSFEGQGELAAGFAEQLVASAEQGGDAWLNATNEIGTSGRESLEFLRNAFGADLPESVRTSIDSILGIGDAVRDSAASVGENLGQITELFQTTGFEAAGKFFEGLNQSDQVSVLETLVGDPSKFPEAAEVLLDSFSPFNALVQEIGSNVDAIDSKFGNLPNTAAEAVSGIADTFEEGSAAITEGLTPVSEKIANEIRSAGEETSAAIDTSFATTNQAIQSGLGDVAATFQGEVVAGANAATSATNRIAEAARAAARAAASINFPSGPRGGADIGAASGFTGVLSRDTVIQAHRGEFVNITPAAETSRMDFRSAQSGMGPGPMSISMGNTQIVIQGGFSSGRDAGGRGGGRRNEDIVDEMILKLERARGRQVSRLQRVLGIRNQ